MALYFCFRSVQKRRNPSCKQAMPFRESQPSVSEHVEAYPDGPVVEMDSAEEKSAERLLALFFRNCHLMRASTRDTNTACSETEIIEALYQ